MDRKVGSGNSGANLFQTKLKFDPNKFDKRHRWPTVAAGIANLAWTKRGRRISGQPAPYLVSSYPIKIKNYDIVRGHVGFGFQRDNEGVFFGFDRPIVGGFTLRTDYVTVNNGRDLLSSWGFIYEPGWKFPFNIAIESWYSVSTQSKRENDVILKFDYIINF